MARIARIKIRLIGDPIKAANGICSDIDCDYGTDIEETFNGIYSSVIIDRADGEIKFLHYPASLASQFKIWDENFGEKSGGTNGPDWIIDTNDGGMNNNGYQRIKIYATHLFQMPITEEEMLKIQLANNNCKWKCLKHELEAFNKFWTPPTVPLSIAPNYKDGTPLLDARVMTMTRLGCTHEWVDVSFFSGKKACKHCDIDKPD